MVLADLRDFTSISGNKKNKPWPRPWVKTVRRGSTTLSPADAKAALARNAGRG